MNTRIKELDYLKCIFIVLMIIFHLVYIGDSYPYAKKVVYTFHMSAFLVISGYVVNINKNAKSFLKTMLWIFIPYAILETGYAGMSSLLPVREKVEELSAGVILDKIFLSPIGPYWYLHTLILCSISYYTVFSLCAKWKIFSRFILLAICLFVMAYPLGFLSFGNAIYFMSGIAIYQCKANFIRVFQPSLLSLLPLVLLCCFPENLDRALLSGVAITYLVISFLLYLHTYLPLRFKKKVYYIGQNTLIILLFSPIFTILSKQFLPFLRFDQSGMIYMCLATSFTLAGCFFVAWFMDKAKLSRVFFGKKQVLAASPE